METTNPPACRACFFWTGNRATTNPNETSECRRYPPTPAGLTQSPGLDGKMRTGIVSAFAQANVGHWGGEFVPFAQTPAAANQGE